MHFAGCQIHCCINMPLSMCARESTRIIISMCYCFFTVPSQAWEGWVAKEAHHQQPFSPAVSHQMCNCDYYDFSREGCWFVYTDEVCHYKGLFTPVCCSNAYFYNACYVHLYTAVAIIVMAPQCTFFLNYGTTLSCTALQYKNTTGMILDLLWCIRQPF